jgi:cytochrome c peroxidase
MKTVRPTGRDRQPAGTTVKKEKAFMRTRSKTARLVAAATAVYVGAFALVGVRAQTVKRPLVPATSLNALTVVQPPNIGQFIQDNAAAIALGKALFWDMQASSDNILACASCHFHAGADDRVKNQLDPNLKNMDPSIAETFDPVATGNHGGPNYTLRAGDFPFHRLADPTDRDSTVLFDSNDIVSSAGVYASDFGSQLSIFEKNTLAPDGVFMVGNVETRRVEPRNTPTVINAALNYRNFWDGRANSVFNGVTPFGPHDKDARVWVDDTYTDANGVTIQRAVPAIVRIPYSSAASQAVGPALSGFEMSAAGRTFADIGHKLLTTKPLLYQQVSSTDSVLGPYCCNLLGFGLKTNYKTLIQQAFWPEYWSVPDAIYRASSGDTHTQMEANFSLFWGLAIQAYEQTLISDKTRFDQYAAGNAGALTDAERRGMAIFTSERGRCTNCHKGMEFTGASTRMVIGSMSDGFAGDGPIENMLMGDRQSAIYDNGFYNIGVVPAGNDLGVGGTDPWGAPLSFARQLKNQLVGGAAPDALTHSLTPCDFQGAEGCTVIYDPNFRDAVDGSFKAPSLRNVELTGPYFHNGGYATLEQVVDFYSRGGNVRGWNLGGSQDSTGYGSNASNFDTEVFHLNLTATEKADLVAFLKSLTDDRVRYERAPFDHPMLIVPNGAVGDNNSVTSINGRAIDQLRVIPAVGKAGLSSPIQPFKPQP